MKHTSMRAAAALAWSRWLTMQKALVWSMRRIPRVTALAQNNRLHYLAVLRRDTI